MINYGLPYMGSKSKIAADLIRMIPSGARFVDVFAGGCAMTHAALLAGRWDAVLANDITDTPALFVAAVNGQINDDRWISRAEFFALKDKDPLIRAVWSFGNQGDTYLYGEEIEPYKRACHYAIFFDDWAPLRELCPEIVGACRMALKGKTDRKARRLAFSPATVRALRKLPAATIQANPLYRSVKKTQIDTGVSRGLVQNLERLERLESLQSAEALERLEGLEKNAIHIESRRGDYRDLELKAGDVLYCDPPYKGTTGYNGTGFDHEAFYTWAEARAAEGFKVYISEYDMPADRFLCVWRKAVVSRMSQKGIDGYMEERLYIPRQKPANFNPETPARPVTPPAPAKAAKTKKK